MAGAGFEPRSTTTFGVKENNYLGKGINLDTNITVNESSLKGKFSFTNPNYKILTNPFAEIFKLLKLINFQILDIKQTKRV